jgi:hypothetical protein
MDHVDGSVIIFEMNVFVEFRAATFAFRNEVEADDCCNIHH